MVVRKGRRTCGPRTQNGTEHLSRKPGIASASRHNRQVSTRQLGCHQARGAFYRGLRCQDHTEGNRAVFHAVKELTAVGIPRNTSPGVQPGKAASRNHLGAEIVVFKVKKGVQPLP